MKRLQYFAALCVFVALFTGAAWGEDNAQFKTLSESITSAGSGGVVSIDAGTYTIANTQYITVTKPVTIKGTGVVLSGDGTARTNPVFKFAAGSEGSTIEGFTFQSFDLSATANIGGGAAIFIDSVDVTVNDCTFIGNRITSITTNKYAGGAAIYTNNANGTVIKNSVFTNNKINTTYINETGGNAIYNAIAGSVATVKIIDCEFSDNHVGSVGNFGGEHNCSGGAIANAIVEKTTGSNLTIDIENCSFDNNSAGRYGGALYSVTDAAGTINVNVKKSRFTGNKLNGYGESESKSNNGSFGGAIASFAASGAAINLDVSDSIFKNNMAYNKTLISNSTPKKIGANGGAICNFTTTENSTSTIAKAVINNCLFDENASNMGGALVNWGNSGSADMTVTNCTFIGNKATSDDVFAKSAYGKYVVGGAFLTKAVADGSTPNSPGHATTKLINCTFYKNTSVSGGVIASYKDTSSAAVTDIINCTFVDNGTDEENEDTTPGALDIYNLGKGTMNLVNTLLWHSDSVDIDLISKDEGSTVNLANCKYSTDPTDHVDTNTSGDIIASFASASTPLTFTSNDITHTYFKPTSNLVAGKVSGDVTPKYDIAGILRSTSTPTIGAVEYIDTSKFKIRAAGDVVQTDGTTLSGDITTSFDVTFSVSSDLNLDNASVDWSASPTSIAGLTFASASGKLTGTPTASADEDLKVTASKVTIKATGYVLAENISGDFKVVITSADAATSDETKTDDTTGKTTVKSPDLTVKITSTTLTIAAGSSKDLTATVTSGDTTVSDATLTWTAKSTLPTGFSISGSKLVVASTVTSGDYTAGVVATAAKSGYNDGTTSADITVTVTVTSSGTNTGGGSGTPATDTGTQTSTDGSTVTLNETDKTQVVVLATNGSIASLLNVLTKGYAINTADGSAFAIKSTNAITATDLANLLTYEFKVTLDLSDAPATITTVNLASAKMPELKISNNKNIRSLTFTKGSNVPKVSARGSNVQTLDLAGNENIKDLDIGETQVEAVDFEGTKVENLSADKSESLSELKNINSCKTTLKTLGIDGCAIAFVDLNGFTKLTNVQLGSQSPKGWGFRRKFKWFAFFFTYGGMTAPSDITESSDIGSRVTNIGAFDVSGNELTVTSDDTGEVSINGDATAFNYEFDSKAQEASSDVSGGSLRASASNVNPAMNVQISGSTTGGDETVGGSGGGCEVGFGIAALMALAFFINKKH